MIDIESLTIKQARELAAVFSATGIGQPATGPAPTMPAHSYPVGKPVFIRTVTMHYIGMLARVDAGELVITDAAWIADSGRFHVALASGVLNEIEPYPDGEVIVPRDGVIDVCRWLHALPRVAK